MSYYILTSLNNLNNILSTESISPACLYPQRKTGITYFEPLSSDPETQYTKIENKLPHPLYEPGRTEVFALELNEQTDLSTCLGKNDNSALTDKTIYLSPSTVNFVFESEKDKNEAWINTEKSIETKFVGAYVERSKLAQNLSDSSPKTPAQAARLSAQEFEQIDRLKGAIFCYCLGESLSVREEDGEAYAQFFSLLDRYTNSFFQITPYERNIYIKEMERRLLRLSMNKTNRRLSFEDSSFDQENCSLRTDSCRILFEIASEITINVSNDGDITDAKLESYRFLLEDKLNKVLETKADFSLLPKICNIDGKICLSMPEDDPFADRLLEALVYNDLFTKAKKDLRYPFAYECGSVLKDYCGNNWNGSSEQQYINALLSHLNKYDPFDADERMGIADDKHHAVLLALAHLCLNNNKNVDLEEYYHFLRNKCGVYDFRLPFSLWGATFGFSEIPKTMCTHMIGTPAEANARSLFREALTILEKNEQDETPPSPPSAKMPAQDSASAQLVEGLPKTEDSNDRSCRTDSFAKNRHSSESTSTQPDRISAEKQDEADRSNYPIPPNDIQQESIQAHSGIAPFECDSEPTQSTIFDHTTRGSHDN